MSKKTRELRLEAEERWPKLRRFLAGYCHEDLEIFHGTAEGAVDAAINDFPLVDRQNVLREWRDWNTVKGIESDPRDAIGDGLGVNVFFKVPEDAREFMNMVYEKVIVSVRSETGKDWKP